MAAHAGLPHKNNIILLYDPKQWKPNLLTYKQIRSLEVKALWSLKHHSKKTIRIYSESL